MQWKRQALRSVMLLIGLIVLISVVALQIELAFPATPDINNTLTGLTKPTSQELGSYDVLGHVVSQAEAEKLLQTESGQKQLSPDNGAIAITPDLINLGRDAFYSETFGNERFVTDVVGALNGPINLGSLTKAILALGASRPRICKFR